MAEYTNNTVQTVLSGQNVLFTEAPVWGNNSIAHREGSGLIELRGATYQRRARFKITFGANIAVPADGTAEAISMAIAINGEPVSSTTMIFTPTAVEQFGNIAASVFIDVPAGCCTNISARNTSTQAIDVQNPNLIVERVA